MPKCIELLPCDWLISNLCYQAIEQVYLIKWPVSVYFMLHINIYFISLNSFMFFFSSETTLILQWNVTWISTKFPEISKSILWAVLRKNHPANESLNVLYLIFHSFACVAIIQILMCTFKAKSKKKRSRSHNASWELMQQAAFLT